MQAILKGDEGSALLALEDITELNLITSLKKTQPCGFKSGPPLHFAILKELFTLAEKIIEKLLPSNFLFTDNLGRTALHLCVIKNQIALSESVLSRYSNLLMEKDNKGNTPLHLASTMPETAQLQLFLPYINFYHYDIDDTNDDKQSALHLAAKSGNEAAVDLLLAHHANQRLIDINGYTASELAYVKHKHLSEKLKVSNVPSLLLLAAMAMDTQPELMALARNANTFPPELYKKITVLVEEEKEYQKTKKQSEAAIQEKRRLAIEALIASAKSATL